MRIRVTGNEESKKLRFYAVHLTKECPHHYALQISFNKSIWGAETSITGTTKDCRDTEWGIWIERGKARIVVQLVPTGPKERKVFTNLMSVVEIHGDHISVSLYTPIKNYTKATTDIKYTIR